MLSIFYFHCHWIVFVFVEVGMGGRGIRRGGGESNLDCLSLTSRDLLYRRGEEELKTLPSHLAFVWTRWFRQLLVRFLWSTPARGGGGTS